MSTISLSSAYSSQYPKELEALYHSKIIQVEAEINDKIGNDLNTKKCYTIKDYNDTTIYHAFEKNADSKKFSRFFFRSRRSFNIHVYDSNNIEAFVITQELTLLSGLFCLIPPRLIKVTSPDGELYGYIKQTKHCFGLLIDIMDRENKVVLKIFGPHCVLALPCVTFNEFNICTPDRALTVGHVLKNYEGLGNELLYRKEKFDVVFPSYICAKVKATLVAALFLIDFMYYESIV